MKPLLSISDSLSAIHDKMEGSNLSPSKHNEIAKELKHVMDFFNLSAEESIVLATVVEISYVDGNVSLRTLRDYYGSGKSMAKLLFFTIESLGNAGYLIQDVYGSYRDVKPSEKVIQAILTDDSSRLKPPAMSKIADILNEYGNLRDLREDRKLDHQRFCKQVLDIYKKSHDVPGIQFFQGIELSNEEIVILIYMAYCTIQGRNNIEVKKALKEITNDMGDFYDWAAKFRAMDTALFKYEIVEFSFFQMGLEPEISLTELTCQRLFSKNQVRFNDYFIPQHSQLITPEKIAAINLWYNQGLKDRIDELGKIIGERYTTICERLSNNKQKAGITIMLHGVAGTGKTETVYQWARATNRTILRLEISEVKTKWVGESERNLKKVFNEYHQARKIFANQPILLFNEADAIFSKRRNISDSVDQMENSLQNILLQELEEFEGIFIATTNLTHNLDQAFERRFLFKLNFEKPSPETRMNLLTSYFPELDYETCRSISEDFDFTGGTLDNIRRRIKLSELVSAETHPVTVDGNLVKKLLSEEQLFVDSKKHIGFQLTN